MVCVLVFIPLMSGKMNFVVTDVRSEEELGVVSATFFSLWNSCREKLLATIPTKMSEKELPNLYPQRESLRVLFANSNVRNDT